MLPKEDVADVLLRIVEKIVTENMANGLILLQRAEQQLRREFGNVQVSDLGHGSMIDLLGLLDPSLTLRAFYLHGQEKWGTFAA